MSKIQKLRYIVRATCFKLKVNLRSLNEAFVNPFNASSACLLRCSVYILQPMGKMHEWNQYRCDRHDINFDVVDHISLLIYISNKEIYCLGK